jgi:hypothetical protein
MTGLRRVLSGRRLLACVGVVVGVSVAGTVVLTRGGGDDAPPAPLPLAGYAAGANTREFEPGVASEFRFVPVGELPTLGGAGPAYRVTGDAGEAELGMLADIFGVEGRVDEMGLTWVVNTREEILSLDRPGVWSYSRMPDDDALTPRPHRPQGTFGETGTADGGGKPVAGKAMG